MQQINSNNNNDDNGDDDDIFSITYTQSQADNTNKHDNEDCISPLVGHIDHLRDNNDSSCICGAYYGYISLSSTTSSSTNSSKRNHDAVV